MDKSDYAYAILHCITIGVSDYEVRYLVAPLFQDLYDVEVTSENHLYFLGHSLGMPVFEKSIYLVKWLLSEEKGFLPAGYSCSFLKIYNMTNQKVKIGFSLVLMGTDGGEFKGIFSPLEDGNYKLELIADGVVKSVMWPVSGDQALEFVIQHIMPALRIILKEKS